jgi:uncharacterized protein (TIGR02268 family)
MRNLLPTQSVLLLLLTASAALARDDQGLAVRTLVLLEHPRDATHRIYVTGQVVTVLRFEQLVDPARTRLLGWEGRFEPLGVDGRKVLLEPLRDLASDEGVPLLVTLKDGMEVPFLVRPAAADEGRKPDQQVNVFKDEERYEAVLSALNSTRQEARALREENERLRKEETSEDHALASLLAAGAVSQTPFTFVDAISGEDEDTKTEISLFRGKGKAAAVFKVKNLQARKPWSVQRIRVTTSATGIERAAAFRANAPLFAPGTSGVFAVVLDSSAFMDAGQVSSLFLEVYRHDGLRTAYVTLDRSLLGE